MANDNNHNRGRSFCSHLYPSASLNGELVYIFCLALSLGSDSLGG